MNSFIRHYRASQFRMGGLLALTLLLVACAGNQTAEPTRTPHAVPISTIAPSSNRGVLEEAWSNVNDHYIFGEANAAKWQQVHVDYLARVTDNMSADEFATVMREMIAELPENAASWESREERIELDTTNTANYEGIGALVSFRAEPFPRVIILATMPSSPAEQAGISAHDSLTRVDDVPVTVAEGQDVIDRVRGPADSAVTLTVRAPDGHEREVVVKRGQISTSAALRYGYSADRKIGYLLFPPLVYDSLQQEALGALQALAEQGDQLAGLIVDLRIARGLTWPADVFATVFNNGELGELYTRDQVVPFTVEGQDFFNSQKIPIVILVSDETSGGAEIFAALMQATGRAQVVGQKTGGNVEGASGFDLSDGSRLVVLTSSYRTPDGTDIGLSGVIPNQVVDMSWDQVTPANDPVLDEAELLLRR